MATLFFGGPAAPAPFLLAGAVYNRSRSRRTLVEGSTGEGNTEWDGGRELGFEVGGGIRILLREVMSFTPAVRYRAHPTAYVGFNPAGGARATTAYWVLDVGLKAWVP